jgi:hypothetical protein
LRSSISSVVVSRRTSNGKSTAVVSARASSTTITISTFVRSLSQLPSTRSGRTPLLHIHHNHPPGHTIRISTTSLPSGCLDAVYHPSSPVRVQPAPDRPACASTRPVCWALRPLIPVCAAVPCGRVGVPKVEKVEYMGLRTPGRSQWLVSSYFPTSDECWRGGWVCVYCYVGTALTGGLFPKICSHSGNFWCVVVRH